MHSIPPEDLPAKSEPVVEGEDNTQHHDETGTTSEEPVPSPESTLPPEAQGETNGGPLGCCLGTVVGLLLTTLLITAVSLSLANGGFLGGATLPIALLGALVGGYFGWRIGKKIYKEYEPPIIKERRPQARVKPKTKRR